MKMQLFIVSLFLKRISIHVISVFLPETSNITVEKLEALDPLHRFPGIEMGNDQTQRISVVERKRLAIMMRGQQNIVAVQINERDIGREPLSGVNEHMAGFRCGFYQFQNFAKRYPLPLIVKTAPARNAMKITHALNARQVAEFFPCPAGGRFNRAPNPEFPFRRLEFGNRAVMQHRPLQSERLPWRKPFGRLHLPLFFLSFVSRKQTGIRHNQRVTETNIGESSRDWKLLSSALK